MHVRLYNAQGLHSIAFAVPTEWLGTGALPAGLHTTGRSGDYTIYSIGGVGDVLDVTLPGVSKA